MNITIFPTGTGNAQSAVNYLLSDTDHQKKKRSVPPEILSGDPNTFADIANATTRRHKYTSGVISLRDNESITQSQITELIDLFRSTFLPGLKVDENFADFWVAHRDKGNLELHFLVANTELKTGSRLNIHPPGEKNLQFFNSFVSVLNDSFGFPQVVPDPLKISLKQFEVKSPNGKKDKKAKHELAEVLHTEISQGFITNRNQLISFLKNHGINVPKIGDDFITVRLPGHGKNTRLKGPLFQKNSDYSTLLQQHEISKVPKFLNSTEAQVQREKLVAGINARTAFNTKLYLTPKSRKSRSKQAVRVPQLTIENEDKSPVKVPLSRVEKQLDKFKVQTAKVTSDLPPKLIQAMRQEQRALERADSGILLLGDMAIGSLDSQIASLSLQYHSLMLSFASATGRRAANMKAEIILLEQRLSALNLELNKKKAEQEDEKKPKYI